MGTLDVKPDLSLLKIELNADSELEDEPINKSRRIDHVENSSSFSFSHSQETGENVVLSARIKVEPSECPQQQEPESASELQRDESVNTDSYEYSAVQFSSSFVSMNFKQETETEISLSSPSHPNQSQNEESSSNNNVNSKSLSSCKSKKKFECKFTGCKKICLGVKARKRHYKLKHGLKIKKTKNTINLDASNTNIDLPSGLTCDPASEEINNNRHGAIASSSPRSSTKPKRQINKQDDKSPGKFSCSVCLKKFRKSKSLYKHKFHDHGILQLASTPSTFASDHTDSDSKGAVVDEDVLKNKHKFNTSGVSSIDKIFQCPVKNCLGYPTFRELSKLEGHCINVHNGQNFPWLSLPPSLKCPIYGCTRKLFQRQTGLESHLQQAHNKTKYDAATAAAAACSGDEVIEEIDQQKPVMECHFPNCSFVTLIPKLWTSHLRLHTGDTLKFKCNFEDCQVAFYRREVLIKHRNRMHGTKANKVEAHLKHVHKTEDGAACSGDELVEAIEEIGQDEQVSECPFENCSSSTLIPNLWTSHHRLHTGDTLKFKCNFEDCGVAFYRKEFLIKHRVTIHGIEANGMYFVCD